MVAVKILERVLRGRRERAKEGVKGGVREREKGRPSESFGTFRAASPPPSPTARPPAAAALTSACRTWSTPSLCSSTCGYWETSEGRCRRPPAPTAPPGPAWWANPWKASQRIMLSGQTRQVENPLPSPLVGSSTTC